MESVRSQFALSCQSICFIMWFFTIKTESCILCVSPFLSLYMCACAHCVCWNRIDFSVVYFHIQNLYLCQFVNTQTQHENTIEKKSKIIFLYAIFVPSENSCVFAKRQSNRDKSENHIFKQKSRLLHKTEKKETEKKERKKSHRYRWNYIRIVYRVEFIVFVMLFVN